MAYAVLGIIIIVLIMVIMFMIKIQNEFRARLSKLQRRKEVLLQELYHHDRFLEKYVVDKELPWANGVKLKGTDIDYFELFNNQIDLAGRIAEGKEEEEDSVGEISSIIIFKTEGFREHFDKEDLAPHVSLEALKQDAMECISGKSKCLVIERNNHQIVINGQQIVSVEVFYKS